MWGKGWHGGLLRFWNHVMKDETVSNSRSLSPFAFALFFFFFLAKFVCTLLTEVTHESQVSLCWVTVI